jgi:uncharacterized membrane protein YbhN (UPF0104 family)
MKVFHKILIIIETLIAIIINSATNIIPLGIILYEIITYYILHKFYLTIMESAFIIILSIIINITTSIIVKNNYQILNDILHDELKKNNKKE